MAEHNMEGLRWGKALPLMPQMLIHLRTLARQRKGSTKKICAAEVARRNSPYHSDKLQVEGETHKDQDVLHDNYSEHQ